jgi:hypothetical protein
MKKTMACSLLFSIFIGTRCLGQHWELELGAGPSFPVGKFADKAFTGPLGGSGLAKAGAGIALGLVYRPGGAIGYRFSASLSSNKQDLSDFPYYMGLPPYAVPVKVTAHSWQVFSLLAGPEIHFPFGHSGFELTASAQLGAFRTSVPSRYYAATADGQTASITNEGSPKGLPWGFAYLLGEKLHYRLSPRMYASLGISYYDGFTRSSNTGVSYRFGSMNITAGVGFKLF